MGTRHWALGTRHWALGTVHWALCNALGTGDTEDTPGTGPSAQYTGHWALGTRHWALLTGHWAGNLLKA